MQSRSQAQAQAQPRSGTQSVERAIRVLREVAARHESGARLTDLAQRCELDMGTTRRILACLVRERMLNQRDTDRRYLPGPLLFELGLTAPSYRCLLDACRAPMEELARRLQGAAFVYVRSGADATCLARHDHVTIASAWAQPGTRKPIASLAAGIAMLVEMRRAEADSLVKEYLRRLQAAGDDRIEERRRMLRRSRQFGFGLSDGKVAHGLVAVAVAVRDAHGEPFASLCFVSADGPYADNRLQRIAIALREQAGFIRTALAE